MLCFAINVGDMFDLLIDIVLASIMKQLISNILKLAISRMMNNLTYFRAMVIYEN